VFYHLLKGLFVHFRMLMEFLLHQPPKDVEKPRPFSALLRSAISPGGTRDHLRPKRREWLWPLAVGAERTNDALRMRADPGHFVVCRPIVNFR